LAHSYPTTFRAPPSASRGYRRSAKQGVLDAWQAKRRGCERAGRQRSRPCLASYNAGDGNVDDWTSPGRDDPDVFAEYVPFAETNDYVKQIQMYWWINRYIWAGQR
jgi:hypothetical protein